MKQNNINPRAYLSESGFAHLAIFVTIAVFVSVLTGYILYLHKSHYISVQGTLDKTICTAASKNCSTYTLQSSNDKTYNLNVASLPSTIGPGSQVKVQGTANSINSSTVKVQSISALKTSTVSSNVNGQSTDIKLSYPQDINFTSTIESDTCSSADIRGGPPIGDVGCNITTKNGWVVQVRGGNVYNPNYTHPGQLINAPSFSQTWTGKSVTVFAQATASGNSNILAGTQYYVKFN
jgi:LysM repeat protein